MDWIERLNGAMRYIEENLDSEIDYAAAARIACCTPYHFQRMFSYMAGITLSEYIRRRRMSLAAAELLNGAKILDTAIKYGYSSPTAFNRAFRSVHGVAPSVIKSRVVPVKSYLPISFKLTIKGAEEMNYRIEKKESVRIVGKSIPMSMKIEENFAAVPRFWAEVGADGTIAELCGIMNGEVKGVLGVSSCCAEDEKDMKYFIAVNSTRPVPEGYEEFIIPPLTWAVFPGSGVCPQAIQELERSIVTDWLPTSGYEFNAGPDIELYLSPDPQNAVFEVWVPVKASVK